MNQIEFNQKKAIALRLFSRHDHGRGRVDSDTREDCGACVLNGYHPKGERRDFINYAGWARVYIQAGRFIPKNLHYAFLAELASKNRAYADALQQDILDYGINCDDASFKRAVQDVLEIWEN